MWVLVENTEIENINRESIEVEICCLNLPHFPSISYIMSVKYFYDHEIFYFLNMIERNKILWRKFIKQGIE